MRNKVSLQEIANITDIPEKALELAIKDESELKDKEDYIDVGSHTFIHLTAALFLIGRFALQDKLKEIEPIIVRLSEENKTKQYSRCDKSLPQLTSFEQSWSDEVMTTVKINAKICALPTTGMLNLIYRFMPSDMDERKKAYLEKVKMPNARISKFRVVTVDKKLRGEFESTMADLMKQNSARPIKQRYKI